MTAELRSALARDLDTAFGQLLDVHGAMVVTLATRLTDPTTGQDITQEAFLRAYRALRGYSNERILELDLRPWLATITRNLVRNEYRRTHRKGTVPLGSEGAEASVCDDLAAVEWRDQMAALFETLSEAQREAVVLRHVVGLPMREVALTMACPEGTAKSHVSRGLAQLRVAMERINEGGDAQ